MSISDRLDTIENGWKPKIFKKIFLDRIEYLDKMVINIMKTIYLQ
jgi:hypothetical protein